MHNLITLLSFTLFLGIANADEHALGRITGTDIDLKTADHAIAGSIRGFVIFGDKKEGKFESELTMKRDGQLVRATFARHEELTGGTISQEKDGAIVETTVTLVSIDQENQVITVRINDRELAVKITADAFENGHFKNPTYTTKVDDREVSFHMEDGHACYGFSTHLVFMILGAYLH